MPALVDALFFFYFALKTIRTFRSIGHARLSTPMELLYVLSHSYRVGRSHLARCFIPCNVRLHFFFMCFHVFSLRASWRLSAQDVFLSSFRSISGPVFGNGRHGRLACRAVSLNSTNHVRSSGYFGAIFQGKNWEESLGVFTPSAGA